MKANSFPLTILYQDNSIIAIDKPAGMLSICDGYQPDLPTVKLLLEKEFGQVFTVH